MKGAWQPLRVGPFGVSATQAGIDPLWIWAEATQYRDFGVPAQDPDKGMRFAIEWKSADDPAARKYTCEVLTPKSWRAERHRIARIELAEPVVPERPAVRRAVQRVPMGSVVKGQSPVLVGIIDSGCPFASTMLRDVAGAGTRVLSIWDQDDQPSFTEVKGGFCPQAQGYGCAINQSALNELMAAATRDGRVDEDRCYRDAGYDAVLERFSHGSAVVSQLFAPPLYGGVLQPAPGQPPTWDARVANLGADGRTTGSEDALEIDRSELVFVQMPRAGIQDSTSAALVRYLIDGLSYIMMHASAGQRVVVNISSGTSRTTHDGASLLEQAISDFVASAASMRTPCELTIVVPTGNTNEEQRFAVLSDDGEHLELSLPPDCEMPQYVTVRWPASAQGVRLEITPPGGESGFAGEGEAIGWPSAIAPECGVVSVSRRDDGIVQSLIAFAPTTSTDPNRVTARSGRWRFALKGEGADLHLPKPVRFWVSRNQRNPGAQARGRQADFVDWNERHNPERYLRQTLDDPTGLTIRNGIRRAGGLSGLATVNGPGIVVVGGLVMAGVPYRPSRYSAGGPSASDVAGRRLPASSAPSDTSWAVRGVSVRGNLSGATARVVGTSFAAPLVARALVNEHLFLERGVPLARVGDVLAP